MRTLVVSYYTEGTGYEEYADLLMKSCVKHDITARIDAVPNLGSWQANCHHKPTFIKHIFNDTQTEAVLWVDADALVRGPLDEIDKLIDAKEDFAAHYRVGRKGELLSGTLWFKRTVKAFALLDAWEECNVQAPDTWDQKNLETAMLSGHGVRPYKLGPQWTFIFDLMKRELPNVEPLIEHFQASRRLRRTIG